MKKKPDIPRFILVLSISLYISMFPVFLSCPYSVEANPLFPNQRFENPDQESPLLDYHTRIAYSGTELFTAASLPQTDLLKQFFYLSSQAHRASQKVLILRC